MASMTHVGEPPVAELPFCSKQANGRLQALAICQNRAMSIRTWVGVEAMTLID